MILSAECGVRNAEWTANIPDFELRTPNFVRHGVN